MENFPVPTSPSRRQVLAVAAATVTLPMLGSAVGALRSANANATLNPAARAATGGATAASEPAGWITTTLKPADLKDNEFTAVAGHAIVLTRADKTVSAVSNKCTHKGCSMNPKAGNKTLICTCHNSAFNLDGSVAKAPATQPLPHYAIRVNDKGLIEIDPGQTLTKDNKGATITIS